MYTLKKEIAVMREEIQDLRKFLMHWKQMDRQSRSLKRMKHTAILLQDYLCMKDFWKKTMGLKMHQPQIQPHQPQIQPHQPQIQPQIQPQ